MSALISVGAVTGLLQIVGLVLLAYWLVGSAIEMFGRAWSWSPSVVVCLRMLVLAGLTVEGVFAWPWFMPQ